MVRFAKILITVFSILAAISIVIRAVRASDKVPETLIYATYDDEVAGQQALDALKQAEDRKAIKLESYAVVVKDANGKTKVKDERKKSTAAGAGIGAVVGLLGGPVGAAVGAGVGGAAGYLRGKHVGMPSEMVDEIKTSLQPGNSAIVALVQEKWLQPTKQAIERTQARKTLEQQITPEAAQ
jgi:uncharacterized membrane protein